MTGTSQQKCAKSAKVSAKNRLLSRPASLSKSPFLNFAPFAFFC